MKKTNRILRIITAVLCAGWCVAAVPLVSAQEHAAQTVTCANGKQATFDSGSADAACIAIGSTYAPSDNRTFTCKDGGSISIPKAFSENEANQACADRGHSPGCFNLGIGSGCTAAPPEKDCALGAAKEGQNCIVADVQAAINFLAVGVGIVVTIMIVIGGIQYLTAGDNPQHIQAAKGRIINALIALLAFLFLYSFLQWLVPGGIF